MGWDGMGSEGGESVGLLPALFAAPTCRVAARSGVASRLTPAIYCHTRGTWLQVNSLREIQALRRLSPHPNIVTLLEVLYDRATGRLALVFELLDMNIYELVRGRAAGVDEATARVFLYQLLKARPVSGSGGGGGDSGGGRLYGAVCVYVCVCVCACVRAPARG